MDTDPYPGHGSDWRIYGFFFPGFGSFGYLEWQGRAPAANSEEKSIPREHRAPAHQSDAAFSERINTRMCPVLLSLTEPESTDKA